MKTVREGESGDAGEASGEGGGGDGVDAEEGEGGREEFKEVVIERQDSEGDLVELYCPQEVEKIRGMLKR